MTPPELPLSYEVVLDYFLGELPPAREAEVEERLFEDTETARRLEVVARIGEGVGRLVRSGGVTATATAETLDRLDAQGVSVRTYRLAPGEVVPCSIASEDFVAVRLSGVFGDVTAVDIDLEARLEGQPPRTEHLPELPVDRSAGELVLLYAGDVIRSFPRAQFTYRVRAQGRDLGEFHLDHRP